MGGSGGVSPPGTAAVSKHETGTVTKQTTDTVSKHETGTVTKQTTGAVSTHETGTVTKQTTGAVSTHETGTVVSKHETYTVTKETIGAVSTQETGTVTKQTTGAVSKHETVIPVGTLKFEGSEVSNFVSANTSRFFVPWKAGGPSPNQHASATPPRIWKHLASLCSGRREVRPRISTPQQHPAPGGVLKGGDPGGGVTLLRHGCCVQAPDRYCD